MTETVISYYHGTNKVSYINDYDKQTGKLHGRHAHYGKNGLPLFVCTYKYGVLDGLMMHWYEDMGLPCSRVMYVDGKRQGLYEVWHTNGAKYIVATYVDDKKTGTYQEWYPNGNIREEGLYVEDCRERMWTFYHRNGNIDERAVFDGGDMKEGKIYYSTGEVKQIVTYYDHLKHGTSIRYYKNGKVKSTCCYDEGQLIGEHRLFYPNGKLKKILVHESDKPIQIIAQFNKDGTIIR